jgi:hypothetical protein
MGASSGPVSTVKRPVVEVALSPVYIVSTIFHDWQRFLAPLLGRGDIPKPFRDFSQLLGMARVK